MLAVYNTSTLEGTVLILYLSVGLYLYVYTVYAQSSSGAYCGGTVGSVQGVAAQNHRENRVINTGSTHYLQDETTVDGSFEHGLVQFC